MQPRGLSHTNLRFVHIVEQIVHHPFTLFLGKYVTRSDLFAMEDGGSLVWISAPFLLFLKPHMVPSPLLVCRFFFEEIQVTRLIITVLRRRSVRRNFCS